MPSLTVPCLLLDSALTSCGDAPTTPEPLVTDGPVLSRAGIRFAFDIEGLRVFNSCTGEFVVFSGTIHGVTHRGDDGFAEIINFNLRGTGEMTGTTYQSVRTQLQVENDGAAFAQNFVRSILIISNDGSPNQVLHAVSIRTEKPTGEIVVDFDFSDISCVG